MKWPKVNFSGCVAWLRKSDNLLLLGILLLALVLRLWGIGFGLPYTYHFDEPAYVSSALNLGAGIIGKQPNPTGFPNILFGEYGLYFVIGRVVGIFHSVAHFEQMYRQDPSVFLLLARITSATFGSLTVVVVYYLGKLVANQRIGLLAGLFQAVAFLHVRDSHYGVPDILMSFWVILTTLLCVLAIKKKSPRFQYLSGLTAGLSITTKWSAWPIGISLACTLLFLCSDMKPRSIENVFKVILRVGCGLFCGILIGGFQLLARPVVYWNYALQELYAGSAGGFGVWLIDTVPGWLFYFKTLDYGLGNVLFGLSLLGTVGLGYVVLRRRDFTEGIILLFPLFYFGSMGSTRHYFARYALPLIPFLVIFAAMTLSWITDHIQQRSRAWATLVLLLLLSLTIVQPMLYDLRHDTLLTRMDIRTLAKQWIENNISENAKIAVDWPVHVPPLSTQDQPVPYSNRVYDLTIVGGTGLADHSLDWYREQGYDYLIASSFIYNIPLVYPERNAARRAFYEELDQNLELVQSFWPGEVGEEPPFIFDEIYGPVVSLWQRERPGPVIKIYRLTP